MSTRSGILSLLVIVNIVSQSFITAELNHRSVKTVFKNGFFIRDADILTNPGPVYGSCHDKHVHDNVFEAKCSFVMETKKAINSKDHLKFCDFTLTTEINSDKAVYHIQSVVGINKNKAVLTLQSSRISKLFVLHFLNCQAVPVKIDFQTKSVKVYAPFDDVFDIFISDEEEYCQHRRLVCKLTVDTQGNLVSGVESWAGNFTELLTVSRSPSVGRIMVDVHMTYFNRIVARVSTLEDNREVFILQEYAVDKINYKKVHKGAVTSITYQFVSLCSILNAGVTCAQFDLNAKLKFETAFNIPTDHEIKNFNVHNLPNGGLLLLIQECNKDEPGEVSDDRGSYYMTKFNAVGEIVGKMVIPKFGKINVKHLHFFVSEDKRMCLSHLQRHWAVVDKVNLDIVCFADEDFLPEVMKTVT